MNATFPVEWMRIFKPLAVRLSGGYWVLLVLAMGVRFYSTGFSLEETFGRYSMSELLILFVVVPALGVGIAFFIALSFRLWAVTVANGEIRGRSYWGFKNQIPLYDISKLTRFRSNGINAFVVNSRNHGQVYISDKTERLQSLLSILLAHLPDSEIETLVDQTEGE